MALPKSFLRSIVAALPASLMLAGCATIPGHVEETGTRLFDGARYEVMEPGAGVSSRAHIVRLDLNQPGLWFAVTPGDRSKGKTYVAKLTSAYLQESHAQIAFNASFFHPFNGGSKGGEDYFPHQGDPVDIQGAVLVNGQVISPPDTNGKRIDSMVCFARARVTIVDGQQCPDSFTDGLAAGPRLMTDGRKSETAGPSFNDTLHPRTAFAISRDRKHAWIVTIDGRQEDSAGMALSELADLFARLGASDAINLDGGGSTTLAIEDADGKPRILNRTIHTGIVGRERPVANHIVVFLPHGHKVGQ